MTSVIASARTSTASVFDVIGATAGVATQIIRTSARAVDALDSKAQLMHRSVTAHTQAQLVNVDKREIATAAMEHADFMEGLFKRRNPGKDFDWNLAFDECHKDILAAFTNP